ncbi:MAG: CDP-diacylglycerol--glycerol-3-phosphate 3-phosphatidyltransferase [Planctomycetes bacterium]|nr:CDP-diacylglycerol--glycerol-3-phosphate 3-phosphatidyltransferase [Planctomycetota bacterium]
MGRLEAGPTPAVGVGMRINLPNQITLARLAMAVVCFACLAQYEARAGRPGAWLLDLSAVLFTIAGLTDIVDGYLARKQNQVTSFGRVIDPFVDKILVLGAYIFLAGDGFLDAGGRRTSDVAGWMVVVILGRELLVTSLRGVTEAAGQSFAANAYGKAKMFLQSVTVVWVMLTVAHPQGLATCAAIRPVLVYVMVAITFLSVIPYLRMARGVLSQMAVATE